MGPWSGDNHTDFDFLRGRVLIVPKEKPLPERFLKRRLDTFGLKTMRVQQLGRVSKHAHLQPKSLGKGLGTKVLKFRDGAVDVPIHLEQTQSDDAAYRSQSASQRLVSIDP